MSGEEPKALNRWLIKKVQGYKPMRLDAEPAFDWNARVLLPWDVPVLPQQEVELNWRPHISERSDRYLEINEPFELFTEVTDSTYMYACSSVHCMQAREMLVNLVCYFPSPVRVWINGQLVITSNAEYINRELSLRVPFQEGFNIILVEAPLSLDRQMNTREFIIKLNPLERLTDDRKQNELIDTEWLEHLKRDYHLIVDSFTVHKSDEGYPVLEGMAQPLCFLPESIDRLLELRLWDACGKCIAQDHVRPTQPFHLSFPNDAQGMYRITLSQLHDNHLVASTYCCVGSLEDEVNRLCKRIQERKDCNESLLETLRRFSEVPAIIRSMYQFVPADWMEQNLKAFYEASVYAGSQEATSMVHMQDVFSERYTTVIPKSIDNGEVLYTVHVPSNFDSCRRYPVVFYFHDAQGRKYPVPLPWMQWSRTSEAIVVDLVGISRNHYADDIQTIRTIGSILDSLPADRERVYGIGFCTGSAKTYRIAFLVPHLFAAFASILGDPRMNSVQPEYAYLDHLEHIAVFGVCGVENWFFNSMRKSDFLKRIPLGHTWMIHGFIHNEGGMVFNSKRLFHKLLQVQRKSIPRTITYTLIDPAFNHSYWVDGIQAFGLQRTKPRIHVQLLSREQLIVRTENVRQFRLLLAQAEMDLSNDVTILLNDQPHLVVLSEAYAAFTFTCENEQIVCERNWEIAKQGLSRDVFMQRIDQILDEDERLGIKKVYVRNCAIVKPDRSQDLRRSFHMKLSFLLQNPIRDRYIAYELQSCTVQEWADSTLDLDAFVHVLDMCNLHDAHQTLLEQLGVQASSDAFSYDKRTYAGNYAAILLISADKTDHLLVAYNSDAAGEALLELWNTFDDNPFFYETVIVWHEGQWFDVKNNKHDNVIQLQGGR